MSTARAPIPEPFTAELLEVSGDEVMLGSDRRGWSMRRLAQGVLLGLLSLWWLAGCATGPTASHPTEPLSTPQKDLAECLELASQVAQHPPRPASDRAARDRYLTMCLESR
jgi:hypothetical protein